MNEIYLKLTLALIISMVILEYMLFKQKQKEKKADRIFQQTMDALSKSRDQGKDEDSV